MWTIGGGVALELLFGERLAVDLDVFIYDPQIFAACRPNVNDFFDYERYAHQASDTELRIDVNGTNLNIVLTAPMLVWDGILANLCSESVLIEPPDEVICRKMVRRFGTLKPSDVFDLGSFLNSDTIPRAEVWSGISKRRQELSNRLVEGNLEKWLATSITLSEKGKAKLYANVAAVRNIIERSS